MMVFSLSECSHIWALSIFYYSLHILLRVGAVTWFPATGTFTVASRGLLATGVLELRISLGDWTQAVDGLTALSLSLCSDSRSHCDRYILYYNYLCSDSRSHCDRCINY